MSLQRYRNLPNELWAHLFTFIPNDLHTETALSLTTVCPSLQQCWNLSHLRLTALMKRILRKKRLSFYLKAYFYAQRVHAYELYDHRSDGSLDLTAMWSVQFPRLTRCNPKTYVEDLVSTANSAYCSICYNRLVNLCLVSSTINVPGTTMHVSYFDLVCHGCKDKFMDAFGERNILGSVLSGLHLSLDHSTLPDIADETNQLEEPEELKHLRRILTQS